MLTSSNVSCIIDNLNTPENIGLAQQGRGKGNFDNHKGGYLNGYSRISGKNIYG